MHGVCRRSRCVAEGAPYSTLRQSGRAGRCAGARETDALVLLDDSFARIVAAIRQGRRIDANIRKAIRFVFAVHVPIIALALVPALLPWPVLLLPVHIVLLELLIDPACSIVFEAEQESPGLMQRPPRPLSDSPFGWDHLGPGGSATSFL